MIMKMKIFLGDLADISTEKETLRMTCNYLKAYHILEPRDVAME